MQLYSLSLSSGSASEEKSQAQPDTIMDWPCVSCRVEPSGKRPYPYSLNIKSSSVKKQGAAKHFITASVIIPLLTNVYTDANFKFFFAILVAKLLALILQSKVHGKACFLIRTVMISQVSNIEVFFWDHCKIIPFCRTKKPWYIQDCPNPLNVVLKCT